MSLLQLPEQSNVSWARLLEGAGEGGSYAYQIDASGADNRNRMMYRPLLPNGGSPSMKTRLRVKSTLSIGNPAFEGLAVRHRGYRLGGGIPSTTDTLVWDSDPATKGKRAWYSEKSGTYTDVVFIEPIPDNLGIDYITFELIVRANGGQVTISSAECRNHYAVTYDMGVSGTQLWTGGFSIETITPSLDGSEPVRRWVRYIKTETHRIRIGQLVTLILKGAVTGRGFEQRTDDNGATYYGDQRIAADLGVMIKLRRAATSDYDYYTISSGAVSVDNKIHYADGSVQFKAKYNFDQVELIPFVEPGNNTAGYSKTTVNRMGIQDIELDMIVADYLAPTQ
mgnify:CR=1 FL=1